MLRYAEAFAPSPSEGQTVVAALDLAVDHRFQFWDALIVTSAVDAGCSMLLSEDMQDGFVVRGLTIANPLAATPHAKLAALLQGQTSRNVPRRPSRAWHSTFGLVSCPLLDLVPGFHAPVC